MRPENWNPVDNLRDPLIYVDRKSREIHALVAPWSACILDGQESPGRCVNPPVDGDDYVYAHTRGDAAVLPFHLNHAGHDVDASAAAHHYAHSGQAAAIVTYYEDDQGIWLYGMLQWGLADDQVELIEASAISGDWRWIEDDQRLRMVGSQIVNVPGFRPSLSNAQFTMAASAAGDSARSSWVVNANAPAPEGVSGCVEDVVLRMAARLGAVDSVIEQIASRLPPSVSR